MAEITTGTVVGNYEVLGLIGSGGMASVYHARHIALGSEHALKVLDPLLARDPRIRNRFLDEGRIQAQLRHPAIVAVTDLVSAPGVAGLVAEFIDGGDLDTWIDEQGGTTDPERVRQVFLPLLDALAFAHDKGIVHRDIKPSNVLISRSSTGALIPRLVDFGIAKVLDREDKPEGGGFASRKKRAPTGSGVRVGTVSYMSPEQVRGQTDLDGRTDVFALAVTLYEFVSGVLPFDGDTDYDTMQQIVEGRSVPIERRVPDVDTTLARCIARGLDPSSEARFGSCREFAEELSRVGGASGAPRAGARKDLGSSATDEPRVGPRMPSANDRELGRPSPLRRLNLVLVPAVVVLLGLAIWSARDGTPTRDQRTEQTQVTESAQHGVAPRAADPAAPVAGGAPTGGHWKATTRARTTPGPSGAERRPQTPVGEAPAAAAQAGRVAPTPEDASVRHELPPAPRSDSAPAAERAAAHFAAGRLAAALEQIEQAIAAAPRSVEHEVLRARILHGLGRNEEALRQLSAAVQISPAHAELYRVRAAVRVALGDEDGADYDVRAAARAQSGPIPTEPP
jgi:serine/threonine protein kinase